MSTDSPSPTPGTEPFSADGGPVGALLSHGFTGSPASMVPWGRHLAAQGHAVRVPRLPGHGTTWQDMNTTRWPDWYGELVTALEDLKRHTDHVVVCGLSMGGALALRLAEDRPDDVAALVLVNPAVAMRRLDLKVVPLLKWVVPSMPGIGNDIKKPGADELGYDRTPLKALASQLELWRHVRAGLSKVTAPLLLMRSTDDHVVDDLSTQVILDGVSSAVREHVTLDDSYHVATLDHDAERIQALTDDFITAQVGRDG